MSVGPPCEGRTIFRTQSGVTVSAVTLADGARLYTPIVAAWMRVNHDRQAVLQRLRGEDLRLVGPLK
jgi:hypothetical protein